MMKKPIEVLKDNLQELIRAREKSVKSFEEGKIDSLTHDSHLTNLTPMIEEYQYVIRVINQYA
jgi:uncharacterized protein YegL